MNPPTRAEWAEKGALRDSSRLLKHDGEVLCPVENGQDERNQNSHQPTMSVYGMKAALST